MNKVLYLNCDGVISKEKNYLYKIEEFNINLENSILVRDRNSDIETEINSGIEKNYLINNEYLITENKLNLKVLNNLLELIREEENEI